MGHHIESSTRGGGGGKDTEVPDDRGVSRDGVTWWGHVMRSRDWGHVMGSHGGVM